jgi:hypothetical protein
MKEEEYKRISQKFIKMVSEDEELSKFTVHQLANFFWYHTAFIIDVHVKKGFKEEMRPLLEFIKTKLREWKE